MNERIIGS